MYYEIINHKTSIPKEYLFQFKIYLNHIVKFSVLLKQNCRGGSTTLLVKIKLLCYSSLNIFVIYSILHSVSYL